MQNAAAVPAAALPISTPMLLSPHVLAAAIYALSIKNPSPPGILAAEGGFPQLGARSFSDIGQRKLPLLSLHHHAPGAAFFLETSWILGICTVILCCTLLWATALLNRPLAHAVKCQHSLQHSFNPCMGHTE